MSDRDVALRGEPTDLEVALARKWLRGFRYACGRSPIVGEDELSDGSAAWQAGYQAGRRALHKAEAEASLYAREQIEAAGRLVGK